MGVMTRSGMCAVEKEVLLDEEDDKEKTTRKSLRMLFWEIRSLGHHSLKNHSKKTRTIGKNTVIYEGPGFIADVFPVTE